jgi:hypothetical protein
MSMHVLHNIDYIVNIVCQETFMYTHTHTPELKVMKGLHVDMDKEWPRSELLIVPNEFTWCPPTTQVLKD